MCECDSVGHLECSYGFLDCFTCQVVPVPCTDPIPSGIYSVVECVALDCLKACVFNKANQLSLAHLHFIVCFDRVTGGQLATLRYSAVDVVGAIMQCHLRQTLAQHHPVRFDVIEVIEHQT